MQKEKFENGGIVPPITDEHKEKLIKQHISIEEMFPPIKCKYKNFVYPQDVCNFIDKHPRVISITQLYNPSNPPNYSEYTVFYLD